MKNRIRKNNLAKAVQIFLFTTVIVTCITFSKYKTTVTGSAGVIIGSPKITTTVEEVILSDLKPGESKKYYFTISNYDEQKETDIEMLYTIEIQTGKYLPLNFELRKVENGITVEENLLTGNLSKTINLGKDKIDNKYELTVIWNESEKNYQFSEEIDYVKILLNSYQAENK